MLDPIEEFLTGYQPEVQTIGCALRTMVKKALPGAHEVLFARHNHFAYGTSGSMGARICYICPMRDYVRLGFMFGTHLEDPQTLLVGEGARMRHVKVRTMEAAADPALEHLVRAAWADGPTSIAYLNQRQ